MNEFLPVGAQNNIQLDFSDSSPGTLFCMYINAGGNIELSTSTDSGETWDIEFTNSGNEGWGSYKGEFEVSNITSDLVYYGALKAGAFRFDGTNWIHETFNNGMHDDIRALKIYSSDDGIHEPVLVGSDGGIHYKNVNVANIVNNTENIIWENKNGPGLLLTQIYGGGSWNKEDRGIYGTQDNGSWQYNNASFNRVNSGDGSYASTSSFFPGRGLLGSQSALRKTDNFGTPNQSFHYWGPGDSWHLKIEHGFKKRNQREVVLADRELITYLYDEFGTSSQIATTNFGLNKHIAAHGVAPSDENYIYVFFPGAYWNQVADVITENDPDKVNNEGELINRVFKSMDGGITFEDLTNNFFIEGTNTYPYQWDEVGCMEIDPRDPNHIFVGLRLYDGSEVDSGNNDILESLDGGLTWNDMSQGLNRYGIHDIFYQDGSDEILYAATDAGVYRWNKTGAVWECFNKALPPCIVTDLDFDYCTNTLTAYTYGKGVWTISTPVSNSDIVYSEDYTVEPFEEHTFPGNVIVEAGATLTVHGHLFFKEHGRLMVKPGGKLIIDGGLLSNRCGGLWSGVEAWGNSDLPQSPTTNQGHVILRNNAVIENAHTGIWVQRNDENCTLVAGSGGGIVQSTNSTIQNCYVGVEYAPYIWTNSFDNPVYNKSHFKNTAFQQTDILENDGLFKAHARLVHVYGIRFNGCLFYDALPDDPTYSQYYTLGYKKMGIGIDAHSSHFLVTPYCDGIAEIGGGCNGSFIYPYFEGLEIAIAATDAIGDRNFKVHEATFSGNMRGIYATGQFLGCEITDNIFTVHPILAGTNALGDPVEAIGTVLRESTGFELEGNHYLGDHFLGNGNPDQQLVGAVFMDTGVFPNQCYRNHFDGLDYAAHAQDNNGGVNGDGLFTGLQFICNDFGQDVGSNTVDISIPDYSSIANSQGSPTIDGVAKNSFSHLDGCQMGDIESDISVFEGTSTPAFSYYYGGGIDELDESNYQKPICFTESKVGDSYTIDAQSSCPNQIGGHGSPNQLTQKLAAAEVNLEDVYNIYYGNVDKGDIKALEDFINDPANSSLEVRNEMISCIPYISDNAFKAAFNRTPSLDQWHVAQVLLMSSPLKKNIVNAMQYSNLDIFYKELVMNGQNGGITNMMIFEADMNALSNEAEHSFQDLAKISVFSDNEQSRYNDILGSSSALNSNNNKFLTGSLYYTQGKFSDVISTTDDCDIKSNSCQVLELLALGAASGQECPRYSPSDLSTLSNISLDKNKKGYSAAEAIIREVYDTDVEIDLRFSPKSNSMNLSQPKNQERSFLTAYPNPSSDVTYLTTEIPNGVEIVTIEIIDALGRNSNQLLQVNPIGVIELDVKNLETGIYLCKMYFDGIHVESEKVIVLH